jgi:hypothetical protein
MKLLLIGFGVALVGFFILAIGFHEVQKRIPGELNSPLKNGGFSDI